MATLRIATRGSDLALVQARGIAARLQKELGATTELVVIQTSGDRLTGSLANQGGKGLFIKEIEEALLANEADLAVHSAKDLPAKVEKRLVLAAFPERADARDALISRTPGTTLESLPRGARVATGSARRTSLLLEVRPDLVVVPMRGNVPTRLAKLDDAKNRLDAIILACAGLDRLELAHNVSERIAVASMLPAVCQGTLALEARAGSAVAQELRALSSPDAETSVSAERAFLAELEGDCSVPLAAYAEVGGGVLHLRGLIASLDGTRVVRAAGEAPVAEAADLGRRIAAEVLAKGGSEILSELRAASVA